MNHLEKSENPAMKLENKDQFPDEVYRGAVCKYEVLNGLNALTQCSENALHLYNFALWCAIGHNRKLARARGHASLVGKLPKYPGYLGMYKALCDTEEYRSLNSRSASYVIRNLDSSIRSWFSNLKSNPKARPPRYSQRHSVVFEVGQNAKHISNGSWRLTCLPVSVADRHALIRVYLPPLTCPDRVESIRVLDGARCAVSYKRRVTNTGGQGVAAIDLGIRKISTVAFESGESILYDGAPFLEQQYYFEKEKSKCKPNSLGKPSRSFFRLQDTHTSRKKTMLRALAHSIVDQCEKRNVGVIIFGDLTGIRDGKDWGNAGNLHLHSWPFRILIDLVESRAQLRGIRVEMVSERYTSRTCAACDSLNKKSARKKRGEFHCADCGCIIHADINGAFNILKKYLPAYSRLGVSGSLLAQRNSVSQIQPSFVGKFDFRNTSIRISQISAVNTAVAMQTSG